MEKYLQSVPALSLFVFDGKWFYKLPDKIAEKIGQEAVCLNDGRPWHGCEFDEGAIRVLSDLPEELISGCRNIQDGERKFIEITPGQFFDYGGILYFRTKGVKYLEFAWLALRLLDGNFCFRDVIAIDRRQFEATPVRLVEVNL